MDNDSYRVMQIIHGWHNWIGPPELQGTLQSLQRATPFIVLLYRSHRCNHRLVVDYNMLSAIFQQ